MAIHLSNTSISNVMLFSAKAPPAPHRAWRVRVTQSGTGASGLDDLQFRPQVSTAVLHPDYGNVIYSAQTIREADQAFDYDRHSSSYPGWATAGLNGWVGWDYKDQPIRIREVRFHNNWDENAKAGAVEYTDGDPTAPETVWTAVYEGPFNFVNTTGNPFFSECLILTETSAP